MSSDWRGSPKDYCTPTGLAWQVTVVFHVVSCASLVLSSERRVDEWGS